ncbi:MAG: hypothetical protein HDS84_06830 [Bacteroidales bacterium]|nr:hypothetical protein [Bacteroidales bacterium]
MPCLNSAPSNEHSIVPFLTRHDVPSPYICRCLPRRGTPRPYNVGYTFYESIQTWHAMSLHSQIHSKILENKS